MRKIINTLLRSLFIYLFLIGCGFNTTFIHANWTETLTELINQTEDGETLVITDTVILDQPIEITKDITIESNVGTMIIAPKSRHFIVKGVTLTLKGVTIEGDNTGGGILVQEENGNVGTLIVKDDTILRKNFNSGHGGAIEGLGAYIRIESGAIISENKAGNTPYSVHSGAGGGIYVDGDNSTLIVEKSTTFMNNIATNKGGAISANRGQIQISGIIDGNTAYRTGGGVYIFQENQSVEIYDATITNNTSYGFASPIHVPLHKVIQSGGGGVAVVLGTNCDQDIYITNSIISNNMADTTPNPDIYFGETYTPSQLFQGGGLAVFSSSNNEPTTWIDASEFIGNYAGSGGGIFTNTNTVIEDTVIHGNTTFDYTTKDEVPLKRLNLGGGIFFDASPNNVSNTHRLMIIGGGISENSAVRGAGIHLANASLDVIHIDGTLFESNKIEMEGYAWDTSDPKFDAKDAISNKTYADIYNANIKDITGITEPYTNIYNNVDISFLLGKKVSFDTNGGTFDVSAADYFNTLLPMREDGSKQVDEASVLGKNLFNVYLDKGTLLSTGLNPIRDGYSFLGWLNPSGSLLQDGFEIIDHINFIAQWKLKEKTPVDDKEKTPVDDKEKTPVDDKEKTPVDDKEKTPVDDKEKTPVDDKEKTPVDDKEKTPVDDKEKTTVDDKEKTSNNETQNIPVEETERQTGPTLPETGKKEQAKTETVQPKPETAQTTTKPATNNAPTLPQTGYSSTRLLAGSATVALGVILCAINARVLKKKNNK